jgi:DNA-directed RNA polymerase subunit M/transcription elongation factor TFIIS
LWRKFIADPLQKLLGKMSEKSSKNGEGAEVRAEESEGLAKKREGEQFTCPRCGRPASYIERQRKGDRVYYVAVHYKGFRKEGQGEEGL